MADVSIPPALEGMSGADANAILADQAALNDKARELNMAMAELQMILGLIGKISGR